MKLCIKFRLCCKNFTVIIRWHLGKRLNTPTVTWKYLFAIIFLNSCKVGIQRLTNFKIVFSSAACNDCQSRWIFAALHWLYPWDDQNAKKLLESLHRGRLPNHIKYTLFGTLFFNLEHSHRPHTGQHTCTPDVSNDAIWRNELSCEVAPSQNYHMLRA